MLQLVEDRKEVSGRVSGVEKQLDNGIATINVINDRLKDVIGFIRSSEDALSRMSTRVGGLEQLDRERVVREAATKTALTSADESRTAKSNQFMARLKLIIGLQGAVLVSLEIWHYLVKH